METLYDRIKILRKQIGFSQEQLALKVGYADKTSIAKIEAGKVDLPQSKIIAFANALNTTTSYLLDGDISVPEGNLINFKNIFLELRLNKGFNQEQIAKELKISKSSIAMWETGKRLPSPELFERIGDYFNVDIDFLYGRTNIKKKILFDEVVSTDSKILQHYDKLNNVGKKEATKRVEELTHIPIYIEPEHLMVDAAHERTDIEITDDMRKHDDDIMNDENF